MEPLIAWPFMEPDIEWPFMEPLIAWPFIEPDIECPIICPDGAGDGAARAAVEVSRTSDTAKPRRLAIMKFL
jgi:hypothetical protein